MHAVTGYLFIAWINHHLLIHSIDEGYLHGFLFWTMMFKTAENNLIKFILWTYISIIPPSGTGE